LKISAPKSHDIAEINNILLHIYSKSVCKIILQVSFERLYWLSQLENTCLLKRSIYPSLKYYIRAQDEELCIKEINDLMSVLSQFAGISVIISLSVEVPFPNLTDVISFLRDYSQVVKMIEIIPHRTPSHILTSVENKTQYFENDGMQEKKKV